MRVLITYHSQTGNTEKVARAIQEALSNENVTLLPASDVKAETFETYDIVFLGSGVYGSIIGKSLRQLMKRVVNLPEKFVLFTTHSSIGRNAHIKAFSKIRRSIEDSNCEVIAEYDCLGENNAITADRRKLFLQNLSPSERKEAEDHIEKLKGHPNAEDLEDTKKFVIDLMNAIAN